MIGQNDSTNGTLFLLTDGHGSTRALVNLSGDVIETDNYDAFGNSLSSAPSRTSWLFGGDGAYDVSHRLDLPPRAMEK